MRSMKTNFGLVAVQDNKILHLCMYEEPPKPQDYDGLIKELSEDPEFGMIHMVEGVDYHLHSVTEEFLKELKEALNIPDDLEESD